MNRRVGVPIRVVSIRRGGPCPEGPFILCHPGTPGTKGRLNALKQRMNTELDSVFESQPLLCFVLLLAGRRRFVTRI
jgi:hypothetical protein